MTILILGGTGFIGTPLTEQLRLQGHDVVTVSRSARSDFQLDLTDVTSQAISDMLSATHATVVVNLAGSGLAPGTADHHSMTRLNARLPELLCSAVSDNPEIRLLHAASSTEVLSSGGTHESFYSQTKAQGTERIAERHSDGSARGTILILHNIYGPTQPVERFVQMIVTRARKLQSTFLNYPERLRDFVYLDDAVAALARIVGDEHAPTEIEIGTGTGVGLREAADLVYTLMGASKSLITWGTETEDPFATRIANNPSPYLRSPRRFAAGITSMVNEVDRGL